jgi:hypothetical protein
MKRPPSPAEQAAIAAGYSPPFTKLARRLRRCQPYVRRLLRHGNAPLHLAEQLAALCPGANPNVFLMSREYMEAMNQQKGRATR